MHRKDELSPAEIDRNRSHKVVLPARACEGGGYNEIHEFCKNLSLCNRDHAVHHEWYHVCCLSDPADAEKFEQAFGGERFDRTERGKGSNRWHWKMPGSGS
jgi:hypothetical protein